MKRLCTLLVLVCVLSACAPQGEPPVTTTTTVPTTTTVMTTTTTTTATTSTVPREWWRLSELSSDEIYETVLKLPLQLYDSMGGLSSLMTDGEVFIVRHGSIYGEEGEVTYNPVLASQPHIDPSVDFSDYHQFRALMETVFTKRFVDELLSGDALINENGKLYLFNGGRGVDGSYESTEFRVKSASKTRVVFEAISTHYPRDGSSTEPWTETATNTLELVDGRWLFDDFCMWY